MREYQSLSHVRLGMQVPYSLCPKYRKQVLYGRTRQRIGRIFHQLCRQKEVGLIEGHAMPDHVHMVLSIPPQHSVSSVLGYLKGKSAIMTHREMERVKHGFTGKHFWAQGYFASTVGLDEEMIREYVRHQEESDDEGQSGLFPNK
jgi:putative transposase